MIESLVKEKATEAQSKAKTPSTSANTPVGGTATGQPGPAEQSREGCDWKHDSHVLVDSDYEEFDDQADPSGEILTDLTPLAAKFATPKNIGAPLQAELSSSLQYMITHPTGG